MTRTVFWSPLLLAVALAPVLLQSNCLPKTGNPNVVSLEVEAGGLDRIVGFDNSTLAYTVWLDGAATLIVRATTEDPAATLTWETGGDYGPIGVGSGEWTVDTPADGTVIFINSRAPGGRSKRFALTINPACVADECDDNDPCTSNACNTGTSTCEFAADASCAKTGTITLACTDTVFLTDDITFLDVELTVTPSANITPGTFFSADLSAVMPFPESILDLAQILTGGVKRATFEDLQVTVHVRSGASGYDVVLVPRPPPPGSETCALYETAPGEPASCDPAHDNPDGSNDDCLYVGAPNLNDPCATFVDAQIEEDCAICASMDPPGATGDITKAAQCTRNGFCIAGPFLLPLEEQTGFYVAGQGGSMLFGLADDSTDAILNPDDTWTLAPASINPSTSEYHYVNGLRAGIPDKVWGFLPVGMECTMGIDTGTGAGTDPSTQQASRTPDSDLIAIDIMDPCEGITCPPDGNDCTSDVCSPLDGSCYTPESYGTPCDLAGSPGVCLEDGVCVDPCDILNCDDGLECTQDSCVNGACVNDPYPFHTPCSQNGGSVCLVGDCVECIQASDCGPASYIECVDGYLCTSQVCERRALGDGFACTNVSSGYGGYCDELGICQDQPDVYMHACDSHSAMDANFGRVNWPVPALVLGHATPSVISPGETVTLTTTNVILTLPEGIGLLAYKYGYFPDPGLNTLLYEATFTLDATNSIEGPQTVSWSGSATSYVTDPDGIRDNGDETATPLVLSNPNNAQLPWTAAAEGQMMFTWDHLDIGLTQPGTMPPTYVMDCAVGVPYFYSYLTAPGFFSLPPVALDTVDVVTTP